MKREFVPWGFLIASGLHRLDDAGGIERDNVAIAIGHGSRLDIDVGLPPEDGLVLARPRHLACKEHLLVYVPHFNMGEKLGWTYGVRPRRGRKEQKRRSRRTSF